MTLFRALMAYHQWLAYFEGIERSEIDRNAGSITVGSSVGDTPLPLDLGYI